LHVFACPLDSAIIILEFPEKAQEKNNENQTLQRPVSRDGIRQGFARQK
jgi:hypothetical protein